MNGHEIAFAVLALAGVAAALKVVTTDNVVHGALYLVVLLLTLEKARRGGWRWLWLLPPLFCLWINSHGSWPMGMVVLGIFIASGVIEGSWGHVYAVRWSGRQLQRLLIAAGTSVLRLQYPFTHLRFD